MPAFFATPIKARYCNESNASARVTSYANNGSPALQFFTIQGELLCTASVCLGEIPGPNEIFIKSWSENEGMGEALEEQGLVGPIIRHIPAGYCAVEVREMRGKLLEAWNEHLEEI